MRWTVEVTEVRHVRMIYEVVADTREAAHLAAEDGDTIGETLIKEEVISRVVYGLAVEAKESAS